MGTLFNIDGKLCSRFQVGNPDNEDGYLSGYIEDERPVIFARVYNSSGDLLFEISHSQLIYRTPRIYRLIRSAPGFRVIGRNKKAVLSVTTEAENTSRGAGSITYVNGTVYDKEGHPVCKPGEKGFAPIAAVERKKG
jgi:hypothetical protein